MTTSIEHSLYDRLGGRNAVAEIISGLYGRMLSHHQTWYYWKGCSANSKITEQQLFIDLVCVFAGGPTTNQSDDMKPASKGLGISKVEMGFFVGLATETLLQSSLEERERDELFSVLTRSKAAITVAKLAPSPTGGFAGYAPGLTAREKEVLRLVALGKSNSEIAQDLYISINTVTRHVTNIFLKTDTKNRVEAAVYAVRHSIL
ncbi:MAG TPA: LuxR C-terminal-related transcriptional regulator [Dehalococcoidia bacterium]|nr:LuxR C-terminal-related transcriptional regulator [Dehalococcoidia bacterium]